MKFLFRVASLLLLLGTAAGAAESYLKSGMTRSGDLELRIVCRKLESTNHAGTVVWLTGVSHIGSSNYYARLQAHLDSMEVVLYEGVGDPAANRDDEGHADSLQGKMARALGLSFQLEAVDYSRKHFVNSDLTVAQLMSVVSEGKDPEEARRSLKQLMASMQPGSMLSTVMEGLGFLLENSPRTRGMVLAVMIEALGALEGDLGEMQGLPREIKVLMKALIDERNKVVISDLKKLLEREKPPASVSIFYGAAHMFDLEERLLQEMGFRPAGEEWLPAIRLKPSEVGMSAADVRMIRAAVRAQMKTLFSGKKKPVAPVEKPPSPPAEDNPSAKEAA